MVEIGDEVLLQQGVWRTSFGPKLMSIVCVNRVFAKAAAEARVIGKAVAGSAGVGCTCAGSRAGATSSSTESSAAEVGLREQRDSIRYFESHDYNAGQHAATDSLN